MDHNEFDQIFNSTTNNIEEAFQYLEEIDELKENLDDCLQRARMNKKIIIEQSSSMRDLELTIENLNQQLKKKNQQINFLRIELKNARGGKNTRSQSVTRNISTKQLEIEVQDFLNECSVNVNEFARTGIFNDLEQSINKLREFFDKLLDELIQLNSQNRNVLGILEALMSIEVYKILYLYYFIFINLH